MKHKGKVLFYAQKDDAVHILLGRRTSGGEEFWWIPGGSVEQGEDPFEAVIREMKEELIPGPGILSGLEKLKTDSATVMSTSYNSNNTLYTVFFIPVPASSLTEEIQIVEEFDEVSWFKSDELPQNMSREFVMIKDKIESLKQQIS